MRKSEFIKALSEESGMSQRDCEKVVDAISPVIQAACIENGEEVSFPIGKFRQKINPARKSVSPLTGKPIEVKESKTIAFKASKSVKIYTETGKPKQKKPRK